MVSGITPYPRPTVLLVATDASGNTYIAGAVASAGLPTTPGVVQPQYGGGTCYGGTIGQGPCPNAFIAKFNSSGALLFLTYLGGTYSSIPSGLVVDQSGNIYVGVAADVSYVAQLSPNGTGLGWLTFVGAGTSPQLALAPDGSLLCLTGSTNTLTKLSLSGQSLASVTVPSGSQAMAVAPDGSVYIGGQGNFISEGGPQGFVDKLTPSLSVANGTALGGTGSDVTVLQAAPDGSVWVSGSTHGSFFVLPGAWQQQPSPGQSPSGFLVHLSADGTQELASTYLPAPVASLALDSSGKIVFSSTQQGFQATPGAQVPCAGSSYLGLSGFFGKIDAAGQHLLWGTGTGPPVPIGPVAVDKNGNALTAGNVPGDQNVTLTSMTTVPGPPRLMDSCIAEAAYPNFPGPLAPGEIISIYGAGFGPEQGVAAQPAGNQFSTDLGGVQVLVEGTPAPLLYVSSAQINLAVPYMLYGHSAAHIKIVTADATSNEVVLGVRAAMPEIFTNAAGAAIINQDGSVNDLDHPAHFGDTVSIYLSGAGQTAPPGMDGAIPRAAGGAPLLAVTVQLYAAFGANVTYAGSAPGIISGVTQVNFQVPQLPIAGVPGSANSADISVDVGGATSFTPGAAIPPQLWYVP